MSTKLGVYAFLATLTLLSLINPANASDPTVNKTALAGQTINILNIVAVNPDCTAGDAVTVRIVQAPAHGTAVASQSQTFPNYPVTNPRFGCNKLKYPSALVQYTAPSDFTGTDLMTVELFTASGSDSKVNYLITVK